MIVVVGSAAFRPAPARTGAAAGLAPEIGVAAAAAGAAVELVARIGDDGSGEELLLALARSGVGHLAVLRDPARPTALLAPAEPPLEEEDELIAALLAEAEAAAARPPSDGRGAWTPTEAPLLDAADVALGLQYLREFRVLVVVEPLAAGGAAVAADAASFADAELIVVTPPGSAVAEAYGAATILEAPAEDPDGAFAGVVGRYAAALDRGADPGEAFAAAMADGGWEVATA